MCVCLYLFLLCFSFLGHMGLSAVCNSGILCPGLIVVSLLFITCFLVFDILSNLEAADLPHWSWCNHSAAIAAMFCSIFMMRKKKKLEQQQIKCLQLSLTKFWP